MDSNVDGKITRAEVQEVMSILLCFPIFGYLCLFTKKGLKFFYYYFFILQLIMLSASANKLSKLKEQAEEYASLIMEELDPENLGYIEVIKT